MLGGHLSATSRDGHTTRQLMLRHGCARAVTPPFLFFFFFFCFQTTIVRRFVTVDLSFFRSQRDDLTKTRWWRFRKTFWKFVYDKKKVFFTWNYLRKWTRIVERNYTCRWSTKKLCNLSFRLFFIRFFDDCKISERAEEKARERRSKNSQFRRPLDERSRNNRGKGIIRAATTQWNNVQPRSATDESISILFSSRKASILDKCSYNLISYNNKIEQLACVESCGVREIQVAKSKKKKRKEKKKKKRKRKRKKKEFAKRNEYEFSSFRFEESNGTF